MSFIDKPTAPALENNDVNLAAIAAACSKLGVKSANVEHPACIHIEDDSFVGKPYAIVGDCSGEWAVDVYRSVEAFNDGEQPTRSKDVGAYHLTTAEGIARFAVGLMRSDHGLLAYASKAEEKKMDRPTRSGRR